MGGRASEKEGDTEGATQKKETERGVEGGEREKRETETERDRDRDKERERKRERENLNSKTLFYNDCSLGSIKACPTASPY